MKNKYEILNDTVILYAIFKGQEEKFYFDLEDLPKLMKIDKKYSVTTDGYLYWTETMPDKKRRKVYTVHRHLLFDNVPKDFVVDHINRQRNDNRKSNLRVIRKELNNSTGYTTKLENRKNYSRAGDGWEVRRSYYNKQIWFGYFKTEIEAKEFVEIIKKIWG